MVYIYKKKDMENLKDGSRESINKKRNLIKLVLMSVMALSLLTAMVLFIVAMFKIDILVGFIAMFLLIGFLSWYIYKDLFGKL